MKICVSHYYGMRDFTWVRVRLGVWGSGVVGVGHWKVLGCSGLQGSGLCMSLSYISQ